MPRVYKRSPGCRRYQDYSAEHLEKAIESIQQGMTQRIAAAVYNIPRSTLKNKLRGSHAGSVGGQRIFSEGEELMFVNHIITMSSFGFPLDSFDLRCIIKSFLDRQGRVVRSFQNNVPAIDWTKSFIKRRPELTVRFASNIKRKRAQVGATVITEYFDNLEPELLNVPASHI